MSLSASLQIGTSALNASQLAIQVAGNNLANAATPGYSRQVAMLLATRANTSGRITVGTGVQVSDIQRKVDEALQGRLWAGISGQAASAQDHAILSQIEDILGELGENDLSSELSKFWNTWSERSNGAGSNAIVVQQGARLADFIRRIRTDLSRQSEAIDRQLAVRVERADGLLTQIAGLNRQVATAEAGGGTAGSLRDQRDQLVSELSQYLDVATVEQASGAVDILVGSTPVVLGGVSRGLELTRRSVDGQTIARIGVRQDGQELAIRHGELGSLLANRDSTVQGVIQKLDTLTSQVIFEVNRLHSTGSPSAGLLTSTGTLGFATPDRSRALNDPANATTSPLPFRAVTGGFTVRVQGPGGAIDTVRIDIDLDGRTSAGAAGFGEDTSLQDIQAALDAVGGLTASITGDGKLKIDAEPGFSFSFQDDTSGVLAVLGVNAYFTGTTSADIGVSQALKDTPALLAAGRWNGTDFAENGTALLIAGLQDQNLTALGGVSLSRHWEQTAQQVGLATDGARSQSQASTVVRDSLEAQRAAVSGVSIDEESINLLTFQRQYQGAARYISIVDELMQTLINLV
ncbi:MAG: flagellar hook-associated protein FlgK [Phycisphaerales bacterium]